MRALRRAMKRASALRDKHFKDDSQAWSEIVNESWEPEELETEPGPEMETEPETDPGSASMGGLLYGSMPGIQKTTLSIAQIRHYLAGGSL